MRSKFGLPVDKGIKFACESDGTEIDDLEFEVMKHFAEGNTTITLILDGEQWTSSGSVSFTNNGMGNLLFH